MRFRSILVVIRSRGFGPQEAYILGLKNSKESYKTGNDWMYDVVASLVTWGFTGRGKVKKSFLEEVGLEPVFKRWLRQRE